MADMDYNDFCKLPQKAKIDSLFVEMQAMRQELAGFMRYIRITLLGLTALVPFLVYILSTGR